MTAIISIHDVSPFFQKEVEIIVKELEDVNKSFLITPLWNNDHTLNKTFFTTFRGEDLIVHGLTHKTSSRDYFGKLLLLSKESCKELYGLTEEQTKIKIQMAKMIFEDVFCQEATGFIPPMWYHNKYSIRVLKDFGFIYTETEMAFMDLRNDTSTFSIPLCSDFGNNRLFSCFALYGWTRVLKHLRHSFVRLSIHPSDLRNGFLPEILRLVEWLRSNNYTFLRYAELIKQ